MSNIWVYIYITWHKIIQFIWTKTGKTNIGCQMSESYCLTVEREEKKMSGKGHMWIFRGNGNVVCPVWGDIGVYNCQKLLI